MSLSLSDLATSTHPLLEQGSFSIYNDPSVGSTNTVEKLYDLDGICFVSRYVCMYVMYVYNNEDTQSILYYVWADQRQQLFCINYTEEDSAVSCAKPFTMQLSTTKVAGLMAVNQFLLYNAMFLMAIIYAHTISCL